MQAIFAVQKTEYSKGSRVLPLHELVCLACDMDGKGLVNSEKIYIHGPHRLLNTMTI